MVQQGSDFGFLTDLDPVLSEIFYQDYRQISPSLLGTIWGVRTSSKAKETHRRIGSFGDPQPWEGQVAYDSVDPDYQIEWVHDALTLGFKVDEDTLNDNLYQGIFDQASNLGQSFNRKVIKDEASPFNLAFSGWTGYDGETLVSASHPRSLTDSTTVSNSMGTLALTDTNLESAIVQLEGLGDDRGEETVAIATHLVVGRQNRKKAFELTSSDFEPESANNAINTHKGLIPVVHPLISGKKWFVVDAPMATKSLLWYWRQNAEFRADADTSTTLVRSFFGKMRYSKGWSDWRWVVGSNAS